MTASDPVAPPDDVPAERVDALYGLPLEEFTRGRDELAKELREAGRRDEGAWVKGLAKPTAAAWLANQLARSQKKETKALIQAGERLREAQEVLLSGGGGRDKMRTARAAESKAVRALLDRASGFLDHGGRSPSRSSLDKVEQTLHAVAIDDGTRAAFALGRLTRESRIAGLGLLGGDPAAAAPDSKPAPGRSEDTARAKQVLKDAKAKLRDRRRALASAERDLAAAQREAERAQRRLKDATKALERARADEAEAVARVTEAESQLGR